MLTLVPAGSIAPGHVDSLADFLESERLGSALDELAEQFDVVLVDTPPLLSVGDAIALTAHVDAILLVLHAGSQRPLLRELSRQLQSSQAPVLGFVLTGLDEAEAYGGYGYGAYTYDRQMTAGRGAERV